VPLFVATHSLLYSSYLVLFSRYYVLIFLPQISPSSASTERSYWKSSLFLMERLDSLAGVDLVRSCCSSD